MARNYLAMDYGGTSGRAILGRYDGKVLTLEEILRFPNYFTEINGICYWDPLMMYHKLKEAVRLAKSKCQGEEPVSIGIDGWGTDYGLLDRSGHPIGNAVCERNTMGVGRGEVQKLIGAEQLYRRTGTHSLNGNTIFQLYERKMRNDTALQAAGTLLMLPDLLGYYLTGKKVSEYSNAATTMILDAKTSQWNLDIVKQLGLPEDIFAPVVSAGEYVYPLQQSVRKELDIRDMKYVPVLTHDTASAIAAIRYQPGEAFCSSGTWSIMGMVTEELLVNDAAMKYNFCSSRFRENQYKIHRDFMGMWMISKCREEWQQQGKQLKWDDITGAAAKAEAFTSFVDVDEPPFFNTGSMHEKIADYCRRIKQPVPQGIGAVSRCVYESIALRYRRTFEELQEIAGRELTALHIVGGGSRNRFMNQLTADAIGKPVIAGPTEAACTGNILVQMMADGQIHRLEEGWDIVDASFESERFEPVNPERWDSFYRYYKNVYR